MAARRDNPADKQREREQLRQEIEDTKPEDISLGMVPLLPGDVRGIFMGLKAFSKRFPEQAEALIGRVQKLLKATPEEMAAGMKARPRNDWAKSPLSEYGPGSRTFYPEHRGASPITKEHWSQPADPPGSWNAHLTPKPPQGPNAERTGKAAVEATERLITRVKSAIKNAPKK